MGEDSEEDRKGTPITLNDQTVKMMKSVAGVDTVVPFYTSGAKVTESGISQQISIDGIDQQYLRSIYPSLSLEAGSLLQTTDSVGIVLGYDVAHPSGRTTPFARLSQTVTLQFSYVEDTPSGQRALTTTRAFQVKGILNAVGSAGLDSSAFIIASAANSFFQKGGHYSGIYVLTRDPNMNDQVENTIKRIDATTLA